MARTPRPNYLGLRSWVSTPHGDIGVYDGRVAQMDTFAGRWQTVCETHGTIISHATLKLARAFASTPEDWCDLAPLPLLGVLATPELFVARFKGAPGRYLVSSDADSYSGQRILDRRQLAHGNLPDRRTGLFLNEMTRTFSLSDLLSIRRAPRVEFA
jgi:hypothetical protein